MREEEDATDDEMRVKRDERWTRWTRWTAWVGCGVGWSGARAGGGGGEVVRRDDDARDDGMTDETRDAERGRRTASAIDRETAHDRARARTGSVEG